MNMIKSFLKAIFDAPVFSSLLKNAHLGMPNSQLQLAQYYLLEKQNFIEAYAWADLAVHRQIQGAQDIKEKAYSLLKAEQIKEAWDTARLYKQNFL